LQANGLFQLKLRVPPGLVKQFGAVIILNAIDFKWGKPKPGKINQAREDILNALNLHWPITYRFCKNNGVWSIRASVSLRYIATSTDPSNGRLGIDINVGQLDATLVDSEGNLVLTQSIKYRTNANTNQIKASIGDAAKELILLAKAHGVPLIHEALDFKQKKQAMKANDVKNRTALSAFAYAKIIYSLESRGQREGVEVKAVNPAYTSLIGMVKYQSQYGLQSGTAAALVIARRDQHFSERMPLISPLTLAVPVDTARHIWCRWADLNRTIRKAAILQRHDWFSSRTLSPAVDKLMRARQVPRRIGKAKATSAPDESSGANRQQLCSAGVNSQPCHTTRYI
jgi:IS605 OrfB family transposase